MPIEGFNYKEFANSLSSQAAEILKGSENGSASLSPQDTQKLVTLVNKLCIMAGETLNNDSNIKFNSDQAKLIVQFVGEYTFHKYIDMINGKIPEQSRVPIINAIVGQIFNTAKLAIIKNMPDDALLSLIDDKVKQVYSAELQKLIKKGLMSEDQFNNAVNLSNLDNMVQENTDKAKIEKVQNAGGQVTSPNDKKVLKLAALAILLKKLPQDKAEMILNGFSKEDILHINNYMRMTDLENKLDHQLIIKSLKEIKQIIPEPDTVNIEKLLKHYRKMIRNARPDLLSKLAMNERENIKNFILDPRYSAENAFSPFVIQSIVNTIEDKLNDN
ncbi:hypothetical protein IJD44_10340 [bacterium]|nr:hypothetical protein [bacterium]